MLIFRSLVLCALLALSASFSHGQNCIDLGGVDPYSHTQNFDGLGTSPAPQNGDALNVQVLNATSPRRYLGKFDNALADNASPVNVPGWAIVEEGSNASSVTGRYNVSDGSMAGGNTYSFGSTSDRSLGSINDDTVPVNYLGGCFRNTTGVTLHSVTIAFTGEMWRRGATGSQTDRLDFSYAVNASNIYAGTFAAYPSFDFVTPDTSGTAGARDGNSAAYRTLFNPSILPVTLAPGESLYVRWIDQNISGSDDGLAIDDFSISMFPTSSAGVEVSGRVLHRNGRGISFAQVSLTDDTGNIKNVRTNTFGYYKFTDAAAGRQYLLSVSARGVKFGSPSMFIDLQDSLTNLDFVGGP